VDVVHGQASRTQDLAVPGLVVFFIILKALVVTDMVADIVITVGAGDPAPFVLLDTAGGLAHLDDIDRCGAGVVRVVAVDLPVTVLVFDNTIPRVVQTTLDGLEQRDDNKHTADAHAIIQRLGPVQLAALLTIYGEGNDGDDSQDGSEQERPGDRFALVGRKSRIIDFRRETDQILGRR